MFISILGGSKNKKRSTKNSPLKRFASDNNISKRNRVPPIGQPEPKGYLTSYQDFNNKWPAEDHHYAAPGIPGELSPTSNSPSGQYLRQRVPLANTYPQTNYQTNIPQHPLVLQQHPGMINSNSPSYLLQQSPYGVPEGAYSPQYNGGHEYNYQSGPPSGSYHHQTRQDPMRQPEYHQFTGHPDMANYSNKHQQPSYMPGQPSGPYAQHPSYDYSGYLNNSQGNQALLAMRDAVSQTCDRASTLTVSIQCTDGVHINCTHIVYIITAYIPDTVYIHHIYTITMSYSVMSDHFSQKVYKLPELTYV